MLSQCEILENYKNVEIIKIDNVDLKRLRDEGFIKKLLDNIIE
jgi:hypothetical protein